MKRAEKKQGLIKTPLEGVEGVSRDVSKHIKAEQEVRFLSSSAEQDSEGVVITDLRARAKITSHFRIPSSGHL